MDFRGQLWELLNRTSHRATAMVQVDCVGGGVDVKSFGPVRVRDLIPILQAHDHTMKLSDGVLTFTPMRSLDADSMPTTSVVTKVNHPAAIPCTSEVTVDSGAITQKRYYGPNVTLPILEQLDNLVDVLSVVLSPAYVDVNYIKQSTLKGGVYSMRRKLRVLQTMATPMKARRAPFQSYRRRKP
jgi:hypothetical protein